jgi:hypothetical protein
MSKTKKRQPVISFRMDENGAFLIEHEKRFTLRLLQMAFAKALACALDKNGDADLRDRVTALHVEIAALYDVETKWRRQ